tara:strand:- start:9916 stop:10071 length:156 start_codon:yes stop_codon:yes gene_type:complete
MVGNMHSHIELIDYMELGLPPVGGGSLDQTAWFLRACEFLKREQERAKHDG